MVNIEEILKTGEKANLEAKLAAGGLPESIWESYSSFANTFGGVILLGIDENKKTHELIPQGVPDAQKLIGSFWNTINNHEKVNVNILVDGNVYTEDYKGMKIVVIEVPRADRRDRPVYVGKDMFQGTYRRNFEGDYKCTAAEIKAMLRDQADTSADALILSDKDLNAFNMDSVRRYRILFDGRKPNHLWHNLPDDQFLIKIGAAKVSQEDGTVHPTLGGLIFFGEFMDIVDELPDYFLDYREHMVEGIRWSDRVSSGDGTWSGNIFDFYFRIVDRLTADVKIPFKLDKNLLRDDNTPLHDGLREALANSLIHADYYGRQGIVIDKSYNKIKISNPGWFRIDVDEAIAGGVSDARNSRIFNMFSLINVGERSGMGLCDLFDVWEKYGLDRPEIIETSDPERSTLILEIQLASSNDANNSKNDVNDALNDANNSKNDVNDALNDANSSKNDVNDNNSVDPNEKESRRNSKFQTKSLLILDLMKKNPFISIKEIAKECGVSESTIDRTIRELKKKGLLKRDGKTKGSWIVLDPEDLEL